MPNRRVFNDAKDNPDKNVKATVTFVFEGRFADMERLPNDYVYGLLAHAADDAPCPSILICLDGDAEEVLAVDAMKMLYAASLKDRESMGRVCPPLTQDLIEQTFGSLDGLG